MRGASRFRWMVLLVWLLSLQAPWLVAQEPLQHPEPTPSARPAAGGAPGQASGPTVLQHDIERVDKDVEQALWYFKLSDVADVDKFLITSTKPIRMRNATGQGAGNPLIIHLSVAA